MKRLSLCIAGCIAIFLPLKSSTHALEAFTITMENVEIREFTESSIQLKSDTNSYSIKIQPHQDGKVIFALSGIGYASTARLNNLLFGVRITGYKADTIVYPTFSFDDVNRDIVLDQHMLIFQRIYGALPVWFNEQVDSIHLHFSNSMGVNVDQYLALQDMKIMRPMEVVSNPKCIPCYSENVMIAIDGSSSIDKSERGLIGDQLLGFVRHSGFAQDAHQFSILEFGTDVISIIETKEKRAIIDALKKYKNDKNDKSKLISWTNWSVALDEAIARRPDVFVFITDGWSNWSGGQQRSFSSQYEELISKTNMIKSQGTKLLFITSDMDSQQDTRTVMSGLLNSNQTLELKPGGLTMEDKLAEVDLITMPNFSGISNVNFSSLIACPEKIMINEIQQRWQVPSLFPLLAYLN